MQTPGGRAQAPHAHFCVYVPRSLSSSAHRMDGRHKSSAFVSGVHDKLLGHSDQSPADLTGLYWGQDMRKAAKQAMLFCAYAWMVHGTPHSVPCEACEADVSGLWRPASGTRCPVSRWCFSVALWQPECQQRGIKRQFAATAPKSAFGSIDCHHSFQQAIRT